MRLSEVTKMGYPENDWRNYLEHSAKGDTWENHKYLYIDANGRYIYPEDVRQMGVKGTAKNLAGAAPGIARRTGQRIRTAASTLKPKNLNRKVYQKTGYTFKGNVKNVGKRTSDAISRLRNRALSSLNVGKNKATTAASNAITKAKFKARKARIDTKKKIKNSELYRRASETLNITKNKASKAVGNAVTKAKFKARKARIDTKNKVKNSTLYNKAQSALGTASRKATNAVASLKPKNIDRNIYKKTGKTTREHLNNARTQVGNFVSDIKERLKKKKK